MRKHRRNSIQANYPRQPKLKALLNGGSLSKLSDLTQLQPYFEVIHIGPDAGFKTINAPLEKSKGVN